MSSNKLIHDTSGRRWYLPAGKSIGCSSCTGTGLSKGWSRLTGGEDCRDCAGTGIGIRGPCWIPYCEREITMFCEPQPQTVVRPSQDIIPHQIANTDVWGNILEPVA